MPFTERDIWAAAQVGADARLEAGKRASNQLAENDLVGQAVWLRIIHAIEELQRGMRCDDEPVH
jgi:hypothetical protein